MERLRGTYDPIRLARYLFRNLHGLTVLIRQERVDIIHANVMRASIYAALAATFNRIPLVWHVRDIWALPDQSPSHLLEAAYKVLLWLLADRIVAVSGAVVKALPCPKKALMIHCGVDLKDYVPGPKDDSIRGELGISQGNLVAGIVGRIRPRKGQVHFLEAAAMVARQYPEARFLIVGNTIFQDSRRDFVRELKELTDRLGIADKVIFTGHREDVPNVLATLDIFVHCAKDEAFGRVIIEAMAAGLPVVAFHSGGTPEAVIDGQTGILLPWPDTQALAKAISELMDNEERRKELGRQGRLRVERHFEIGKLTREIERVYLSL